MFNKIFNSKGPKTATPPKESAPAATPDPKPKEALKRDHATAGTASVANAEQFLSTVKGRRTIYALGKDKVLSDKEITSLIESAVREAPSAFNSQSSRVVVLLGAEHDAYWNDIVLPDLAKILDAESLERQKGRIEGFKAGYGSVLFFEDEGVVTGFQEKIPAYASQFPIWSTHGSGMAQIYVWNVVTAAGYGANLQHYGSITQSSVQQKYSLPPTWKAHSELVFGSVKSPAGEKSYVDDAERFKIFGAQ